MENYINTTHFESTKGKITYKFRSSLALVEGQNRHKH